MGNILWFNHLVCVLIKTNNHIHLLGDANDITEVLGNVNFTNTELIKGITDGSKVQLLIQDQPSGFIDLNLNSLTNVIIR